MYKYFIFLFFLLPVAVQSQQSTAPQVYTTEVQQGAENGQSLTEPTFQEVQYTAPEYQTPDQRNNVKGPRPIPGSNTADAKRRAPPPGYMLPEESKPQGVSSFVIAAITLSIFFGLYFILQYLIKRQNRDRSFHWEDYNPHEK